VELYDAFDRAIASTAGIVKSVAFGQARAPTPCPEWTVRDLLNHVIGTLWLSEALFNDSTARYPMAPGGLPATDLAGDDPAAAYADASAAALTAASTGDALSRVHATALGDMPGPALAGFTTLDILVHGWDLAKATGQQPSLDDAVTEHVLAFAEHAITPGFRGTRVGAAIPVSPDASVTDRLVAFMGRQP
jgi:uncharacterized protein (TIGR03086 family)